MANYSFPIHFHLRFLLVIMLKYKIFTLPMFTTFIYIVRFCRIGHFTANKYTFIEVHKNILNVESAW